MVDYAVMSQSLYSGKAEDVRKMSEAAVAEGRPPEEILEKGLIAGMSRIGEDFKNNKVYVPEVLIAARAMKAGMGIIRPLLTAKGAKPVGTIVIGTVKGDLHDIGKNLVGMMMEGAGFKVVDLGTDAKPEAFVAAAKEHEADLIGMSALLTTTMVNMKGVIEALKTADVGGKVQTMVGGAPLTQKYADEIGADGYAPDAASAVDKAKELLGIRKHAA